MLSPFEQEEVKTYSDIWFVGPSARKLNAGEGKGKNFGYDDDKGRYKCVKNDHVAYRFEVLKGLGKGSFGDVVKA
jgi:dual specificity tyrosine-phosphorylation-regulated kinase 2/3/4